MKPTLTLLTALLLMPLAALAQDSATKPGSGQPAFFEEHVLWQNKEENARPPHTLSPLHV